jgi:hypothetical protein
VKIVVHQAICGEQHKAWDLIATTLDDWSTAKKIAFRTDLQDSPPSGIDWSPALRGFLYENHYLIIKTYIDKSPDVRKGRVFSHCLIIAEADLKHLNDISPLLLLFKPNIDKGISLTTVELDLSSSEPPLMDAVLEQRFNKIYQNFINLETYKNTIVWVGKKNFDSSIARFWQLLDHNQRSQLNFGMNFNPVEIPKDKINFITVPETLEPKFENQNYCLIKKNDSAILTEFAEQYLAGDENYKNRLAAFAQDFEFDSFTLKDLATIAKGVNTYEKLDTITDHRVLNTYANIVAKYSPDQAKGGAAKKKLLTVLSKQFETADTKGISLLRNFPVESFKDSQNLLIKLIEKWVEQNFLSLEEPHNEPWLLQTLQMTNDTWWFKAFKGRFNIFFTKPTQKTAKVIWARSESFEFVKLIFGLIPDSVAVQAMLKSSMPAKIKISAINTIKPFVVKKKWFSLYACLLKKGYSFEDAVMQLLKVDKLETSIDGVKAIIEGASSAQIVNVAVVNGDKRLIDIASSRIKTSPVLLKPLKIDQINWQRIWVSVLNKGLKLEQGVENLKETIYGFLDTLVKKKNYEIELLTQISNSDYGNILNYPKRNLVWDKVPENIRETLLVKTSSSFLDQLSRNSTISVPDDRVLSDYIKDKAIGTFLYYNRNNIKSALPIFIKYNLPENTIKVFIDNYFGAIDVVDATQLGQLALKKQFTNLANAIYDKTSQHKNFRIALDECSSLLDFLHRGAAWVKGKIKKIDVDADEWWEAFIELSYKLYSSGPTENKIWKQADGEEYDLLTKGTGKEVWIAALHKLRKKECAGITVKKLLKKMKQEHKNSTELETLKDLYKKI